MYIWYADTMGYSAPGKIHLIQYYIMNKGQTYKTTFTTGENTHYLYIKDNNSMDFGLYFDIEPLTTYTIIAKALETNLSVVGGMKLQLMLVRGNYEYDEILPYGENIYMPRGN